MSASRVIVFDGVCSLCSAWVRLVAKRDRREFQFATMQSAIGRALLLEHGIDPNDPVTFLLLDGGVPYTDSDAALRIVERLGKGWRLIALGIRPIPRAIRNRLYRWLAANRYRLFGRRDTCFVPRPEDADRFL